MTASVTTFRKDTLSGEGYTLTRDCEFTRIDTMLGLPYNCVHVVEEGDHLLQDQVIIMNDKGRPEWNHAKIAMIQLQVSAEKEAGGRLDKRHIIISNTRLTLVDSDPVSGALPVWSNAVVNMPFAWRMSKGKKVATFDLAKLSDWEYNKTMLEKYAAEQEAKKLLLLSSAVASNMPEVLEVDSSEVIVNEDHTTAAASPLLGK